MQAIVSAPIAQRETVFVIRSHTSSQRSASSGISMLPTAPLSRSMSSRRNRVRKMRVKSSRPIEKAEPASPRRAEIASGMVAPRLSAPDWTFSAAPESPSQSSSPDERRSATSSGRSCRKSRTLPASGTSRTSASTVTTTTLPRTRIVADKPRPRPVARMKARTGTSKTSARKMPRKTMSSVSRIEMIAAARTAIAAARSSVPTGIGVSTTRRQVVTAPRRSKRLLALVARERAQRRA